jgi:hypothetical protein
MSAESAVMGLRRGWLGMAMSMMTTLFCGEVSRTQMYLSDSMVTWVKVTNCGAIPRLVSVSASRMAMGALAAAMAEDGGGESSLEQDGGGESSLEQDGAVAGGWCVPVCWRDRI